MSAPMVFVRVTPAKRKASEQGSHPVMPPEKRRKVCPLHTEIRESRDNLTITCLQNRVAGFERQTKALRTHYRRLETEAQADREVAASTYKNIQHERAESAKMRMEGQRILNEVNAVEAQRKTAVARQEEWEAENQRMRQELAQVRDQLRRQQEVSRELTSIKIERENAIAQQEKLQKENESQKQTIKDLRTRTDNFAAEFQDLKSRFEQAQSSKSEDSMGDTTVSAPSAQDPGSCSQTSGIDNTSDDSSVALTQPAMPNQQADQDYGTSTLPQTQLYQTEGPSGLQRIRLASAKKSSKPKRAMPATRVSFGSTPTGVEKSSPTPAPTRHPKSSVTPALLASLGKTAESAWASHNANNDLSNAFQSMSSNDATPETHQETDGQPENMDAQAPNYGDQKSTIKLPADGLTPLENIQPPAEEDEEL